MLMSKRVPITDPNTSGMRIGSRWRMALPVCPPSADWTMFVTTIEIETSATATGTAQGVTTSTGGSGCVPVGVIQVPNHGRHRPHATEPR